MNNQQRGVYQPLGENLPLYDLADDDIEEERSRLPLLIVIALVILAAFAGVVWVAYNQGVARGRATATVVDAPNGPVRTAPDNAGGGDSPYAGLKVYSQSVPPDQEAQSSSLAKPADQASVGTPPIQVITPPAAPAQSVAPSSPSTDAPPARLNPPSQLAPAKSSVATTEPVAAAVSVSGSALLQIGAYESVEIANSAWAAFKARYADVASNLMPDIQKVDLGAKGIWYRLRVGPFGDKASATTACDKLKAAGATCFLTTP